MANGLVPQFPPRTDRGEGRQGPGQSRACNNLVASRVLDVTTSEAGEVTGKLTFAAAPGLVLKVSGKIISATDKFPASVELIGAAGPSVNKIKGFFIPESDHVVGTIMSVANDPLKQPNGTLGPFVLVPIKA